MKKTEQDPLAPRPGLDFSKGVRGKYTNLFPQGTNVAVIEPELHEHFPDSESVNKALRAVLLLRESVSLSAPSRPRKRAA